MPNPMEALAPRLEGFGWRYILTSDVDNRYLRLADMIQTIVRCSREIDVIVLTVYGGRSVVVEDVVSHLARSLRKPLVLILAGGDLPSFFRRHPKWASMLLGQAAAVVAQSNYLASIPSLRGADVSVIPNAIDAPFYQFRVRRELEPNLLWMRAFHEAYNPQLAVRVLARVRGVMPEARLTMAGRDMGEEAVVRQRAAALGVSDAIDLIGFASGSMKTRAFDEADVFLNTNRIDNTPVTLLEAAAAGVPVVATAVGGVPTLIEASSSGLLVNDDDDEEMAAAVLRLMRDPDLAEAFSRAGRTFVEKTCSFEAVSRLWDGLLSATVGA